MAVICVQNHVKCNLSCLKSTLRVLKVLFASRWEGGYEKNPFKHVSLIIRTFTLTYHVLEKITQDYGHPIIFVTLIILKNFDVIQKYYFCSFK